MQTKYIIITGGVLSGLERDSIRQHRNSMRNLQRRTDKCDGYLNVDPGTMNPVEHGEVFVLDDGGEVDLDFGHYERFLNKDCKFAWNLTSGKIFTSLVEKERKGEFLERPYRSSLMSLRDPLTMETDRPKKADIVIIEIGGTVGDLENLWFLTLKELACRSQAKRHHVCTTWTCASRGQPRTAKNKTIATVTIISA